VGGVVHGDVGGQHQGPAARALIVKKKGLKKAGASGVRAGEARSGTSSASAWDPVTPRTNPAGCGRALVAMPACLVCRLDP